VARFGAADEIALLEGLDYRVPGRSLGARNGRRRALGVIEEVTLGDVPRNGRRRSMLTAQFRASLSGGFGNVLDELCSRTGVNCGMVRTFLTIAGIDENALIAKLKTQAVASICAEFAEPLSRVGIGANLCNTELTKLANALVPTAPPSTGGRTPVGTGVSSGATSTTAGYRCVGTTPTCVVVSAKGTNAAALMGKALDAARCSHLAAPSCANGGGAPGKTMSTGVKVAIGVGGAAAVLLVLPRLLGR
jgi:hypothetical protein